MCVIQKEAAIHRSKFRDGPFKLNLHPRDYFQGNPYHSDKPLAPAHKPLPPAQKVSPAPFKPSSPSKQVSISVCSTESELKWNIGLLFITNQILPNQCHPPVIWLFMWISLMLDWRNESRDVWQVSLTFSWSIRPSPFQTNQSRANLPSSSWS